MSPGLALQHGADGAVGPAKSRKGSRTSVGEGHVVTACACVGPRCRVVGTVTGATAVT